jgi:hypothetical protein
VYLANGQYNITISGETYDAATHLVFVTPIGTASYAYITDVGAAFRVNTRTDGGALTDTQFSFVVYKP